MNFHLLLNHLFRTSLFVSILIPSIGDAQQDFNQFKTLTSSGEIPADFTLYTSEKVEADIANDRVDLATTSTRERVFVEGIHTGIDELLMSGSVIYGDEISNYVTSVAKILLKDEPELFNQLRFYTIKSNVTNALSTDQGIVFVTTGLISQLESEAQLAYVLSHEIAHYTEKHVQDNFEYTTRNNRVYDRIEKMSNHSKENELEADKLALKRFHAAGYSKAEVMSAFDVLMYSYLPFDEEAFPKDYFNTNQFYIPEKIFGKETYPIKAQEDEDDTRSSHPNIKKRKEAITEALNDYTDWDSSVNILGTEKFKYIRDVSRFESLRTNIIHAEFSQALYSIFLLEQNYPNSEYLDKMKALTWLSMIQLNENGNLNEHLPKSSTYEGESGQLYHLIKKFTDRELTVVGLRTVYDLHQKHPESEYFDKVYDRLLETVASSKEFNVKEFSPKNFYDAAEESIKNVDTTTTTANKSKYDKIRSKKEFDILVQFDSLNFYVYGIPDIIKDSNFLETYNHYKSKADSLQAIEDAYDELTYQEQKQLRRKQAKSRSAEPGVSLGKFIIVEPTVTYYTNKSRTILQQEQDHNAIRAVLLETSEEVGLSADIIDQEAMIQNGTSAFNERNAYISFLEQSSNFGDVQVFPADHDLLNELTLSHGTSTTMFTSIDYSFQPNINWFLVAGSVALFPTLPITLFVYLPVKIFGGRHTEINSIVFDAEKGKLVTFESDTIHTKPKKGYMVAYYFQLFSKLNNSPQ